MNQRRPLPPAIFALAARVPMAIALFIFLALPIAFAACAADPDDPKAGPFTGDGGEGAPVTATIPAREGGKIVSSDGKATLTVPPGALAVDTAITVKVLPRSNETAIDIYDFAPDGLVFAIAARLEFSLDASTLADAPRLKVGITHGQGFTPIPSSVAGSTLTGEVAHFTGFSAIVDPNVPIATALPITVLVAGANHTCYVVPPANTVKCWGFNSDGQTGVGGAGRVPAPTDVPNLADVLMLAAGDRHTCALVVGGTVKCWGANDYEQLGMKSDVVDGGAVPIDTPRVVPGLVDVASISAAGNTTCAITTSGTELCWGAKFRYERLLGQPPAPDAGAPIFREQRPFGVAPVGFSMDALDQCVVDGAGGLYCTPYAPGNATAAEAITLSKDPLPATGPIMQKVPGIGEVAEVVMGSHVPQRVATEQHHICARLVDGTAWCWTHYGTINESQTPIPVPTVAGAPLANVTKLVSGEAHVCAIHGAQNEVACWGRGIYGAVGPLTPPNAGIHKANPIANLTGVTAIAAGEHHSCAAAGSAIFCWGSNNYDQIGGQPRKSDAPQTVVGVTDAVDVVASRYLTCARTAAGASKCWPYGPSPSKTATVVDGLASGVTSVGLGPSTYCAAKGGGAYCWGYSLTGIIPSYTQTAALVPELTTGVVGITGAMNTACALLDTGAAKCWGYNAQSQVVRPTAVPGVADGVAVAGGGNIFCAVTAARGVKCWGYQPLLGNGSTDKTSTDTAVEVAGLTGVRSISVGTSDVCAILEPAGSVKCWGYANGLLTTTAGVPTEIPGLSGVVATSGHCAVLASGKIMCGGAAGLQEVPSIGNAAGVAAGGGHTCARLQTGGVQCWGGNGLGELGTGRVPSASVPVAIPAP